MYQQQICARCKHKFTPSHVVMKARRKRGRTDTPKICATCTIKALDKLFKELPDDEDIQKDSP